MTVDRAIGVALRRCMELLRAPCSGLPLLTIM